MGIHFRKIQDHVILKYTSKPRRLTPRLESCALRSTTWLVLSNGDVWLTTLNHGYVKWDGSRKLPEKVLAALGKSLWDVSMEEADVKNNHYTSV